MKKESAQPADRSIKPEGGRRRPSAAMRWVGESFLLWRRYRSSLILPFGITLQQVSVLRRLADKAQLRPSEVADLLFCDRPTASVVLRNLEKRGWISRRRDRQDARGVWIHLTDKGREKLNDIKEAGVFRLEPFDPLACFTPTELDEFERLLSILRAHLETVPSR